MRYRTLKIFPISRKNRMIAVLLTALSVVYGCGDSGLPSPANGGGKKLPSILASVSPKVPTVGSSDSGFSNPAASGSGVPASTVPSGGAASPSVSTPSRGPLSKVEQSFMTKVARITRATQGAIQTQQLLDLLAQATPFWVKNPKDVPDLEGCYASLFDVNTRGYTPGMQTYVIPLKREAHAPLYYMEQVKLDEKKFGGTAEPSVFWIDDHLVFQTASGWDPYQSQNPPIAPEKCFIPGATVDPTCDAIPTSPLSFLVPLTGGAFELRSFGDDHRRGVDINQVFLAQPKKTNPFECAEVFAYSDADKNTDAEVLVSQTNTLRGQLQGILDAQAKKDARMRPFVPPPSTSNP